MKNATVVAYNLLALGFMVLTFTKDWLFIIPAVVLTYMGGRILLKQKSKK